MRKIAFFWTLLVAACVAAGPALAEGDPLGWLLPENPLDGGTLFFQKGCIQCHAIYGEGGRGGPDLGKTKLTHGFLEVAGVMWNHSPRMEEEFRRLKLTRPTFTPEEMAKIIAFVYFLSYFDSPGDPEHGRMLFAEKGCGRCHSVNGAGGRSATALDRFHRYVSPVFLATAMWNNGVAMSAAMQRQGVRHPSFGAGDIRDIVAYIRTRSAIDPNQSHEFLPPGNPRNGARLFQEKRCADCHSLRSSRWSAGPDLGRAELHESLSTIAGFQWNHGPAMWDMMRNRGIPIPQFTVTEMSDLIAYLYFSQYVEEPGDAAAGEDLFREKGCGFCHGLAAGGPGGGPMVVDMEPFDSPAQVIASMWNHASEMEQMTWEINVVWPVLKEKEMADLIAFLLAKSRAPDPESP